jgi:putative aldouronate transport system substrate-binding protein
MLKSNYKKRVAMKTASLLLTSVLVLTACTTPAGNGASGTGGTASGQEISKNGSGEGAKTPVKDLYVIKMFTDNPQATTVIKRSDETPVGKIIKDKFNIVFELLPFSGNYIDKLNIMLASGDYPELLRIEGQMTLEKYIAAGALLNLDEYLKKAPNFNALYKDALPYWKKTGNGKVYNWNYGLPIDASMNPENLDILIRRDILEEAGWPKLLSTDDYVKLLSDAIKKHPTTNGKKTLGLVAPFGESYGMLGISTSPIEKGGRYIKVGSRSAVWNAIDNKFEDQFKNEYNIEGYRFYNKLYRAGAFDKESFTDKADQVTAKLQDGRALALWYLAGLATPVNNKFELAGTPQYEYINVPIKTPKQIERNESRIYLSGLTRPFDNVAITKNAKQPDRLFELIEWASSPEGQLLLQSGIEGTHYKIENGKRVPTDDFKAGIKGDPLYLAKQGIGILPFLGMANSGSPTDGQHYSLTSIQSVKDELLPKGVMDAYRAMGWKSSKEWWFQNGKESKIGLPTSIVIDPTSKLGAVEQKMIDIRVKNSAKLIMSESDAEFDKNLKEIMDEYDKINPGQVIDKYNELYQEGMKELDKYK